MKGIFVTFEGIDGSGKSTQARLLCEYVKSLGRKCVLVREPGGTPEGERIRDILLSKDSELTPESEFFLFSASRSILTKRIIIPELKNGSFVISDRYADSSLAYQGYGRGVDLDLINLVNSVATYNLQPDVTFYIDISVEEAFRRKKNRDRMEKDMDFLRRVRDGYIKIAKSTGRIVIVNGERSIDDIWKEIKKIIDERLLGW